MIKSGKGGGNTKTGLVFEGKTDILNIYHLPNSDCQFQKTKLKINHLKFYNKINISP